MIEYGVIAEDETAYIKSKPNAVLLIVEEDAIASIHKGLLERAEQITNVLAAIRVQYPEIISYLENQ